MYSYLMDCVCQGLPFDADGAADLARQCKDAYDATLAYDSDVNTSVYGRAVGRLRDYCGAYGVNPADFWPGA